MKLNETVLQKLAEWRPTSAERARLVVTDEAAGWTVLLSADRNDELGSLVWELTLRRNGPAPAGATLESWAKDIAASTTGLLEPLRVIEVDLARNEAQLRSQQPNQRGDALYYFEVLLSGTTLATLRRYQAAHAHPQPRSQVTFPMTHETLAKVVSDLAN